MPDLCFSDIGDFSDQGLKEMLEDESLKMFGTDDPLNQNDNKPDHSKPLPCPNTDKSTRLALFFHRITQVIRHLIQRP